MMDDKLISDRNLIDILRRSFRWGTEENHEKSYVMIYDVFDEIRRSVSLNSTLENYMSFEAICSRIQL